MEQSVNGYSVVCFTINNKNVSEIRIPVVDGSQVAGMYIFGNRTSPVPITRTVPTGINEIGIPVKGDIVKATASNITYPLYVYDGTGFKGVTLSS